MPNFAQYNKNKHVIESDHNGEILELDIEFSYRKQERKEMFNLKNKACQAVFKIETEHNDNLAKVFDNDLPFEVQCNIWFKNFNDILHKCFKKVRIVNSLKKKEVASNKNLLVERVKLLKDSKSVKIDESMKTKIEERIKKIEEEIGNDVLEENIRDVVDTLKVLGGEEHSLGGTGRKIWKLLKDKYPKILPAVPVEKAVSGYLYS